MTHIDVPPGRAAQSLWCGRNWHDGTCCPGSIRQWHQDRDLLPPEPPNEVVAYSTGPRSHGLDPAAAGWEWAEPHARGDHSACDRNCEATL
jgi:hypothetical protein